MVAFVSDSCQVNDEGCVPQREIGGMSLIRLSVAVRYSRVKADENFSPTTAVGRGKGRDAL
jgi:hypothetical protein